MSKSKFSDLNVKIQHAQSLQNQVDFTTKIPLYPNAVAAVVNAHAKFYGLRSKYDGRGNLRTPLTAATFHA